MLNRTQFHNRFLEYFGFTPTDSQSRAISSLSGFIYEKGENYVYLLQGYAGTGKTSLVSALVKTLEDVSVHTVLLAPTGRAAKVFASYAGRRTYTIHKWIYRVASKHGVRQFMKKKNKDSHTLYIIDEASMIPATASGELPGMGSLLDDLMDYIFSGECNRILFIGDDAQLPPVHSTESPALDEDFLRHSYNLVLWDGRLTDVVRQTADSGILYNATLLRNKITAADLTLPLFGPGPFRDFLRVNGMDLEELLNTLYQGNETDEIVTVTRSNKRANLFNRAIREKIFYRENEIAAGDYIMAVKNNYFWIEETSEIGFIANGDIMEILAIHRRETLYGFHFADLTVRLCDYPDHPDIDIKVILESLEVEGPSLTYEDNHSLYDAVAEDYADIKSPYKRFLSVKNSPFLNAVQVKFAYSLTCHKTQGGQWRHVLIDQGYFADGMLDREYLRWLYTAVTRSTEKVYLINFDERF